ncbi:MAG: YXWGXW repeat-containing protein, partial [Metallibacterium sp.]
MRESEDSTTGEEQVMHVFSSLRKILLALAIVAMPASSFAGVFVSVAIAPPALPVYTQPVCPGVGYLWTPGYWGYGAAGYYWVPGVWVHPPRVGLLWTPGYWGFAGGMYAWHAGYWGPHVGFYGGVNYGFGYGGVGFAGGYWRGGNFFYNRSVMNVNTTVIHNTYNRTVINNTVVNNRVSYNGGAGGIRAVPTAAELQ